MKQLSRVFLILLIFNLSLPAFAQQDKLIQLKDGSNLSGQVLGLVNGVYTIRTENLGTIKIEEENILSISTKSANKIEIYRAETTNTIASNPSVTPTDMSAQMQAMQQNIMSNPNLMADIQAMASDPEIVQLLQDQSFIQSLMSMDMASIENDPRFKQLIGNAKIRAFIEKFKSTQNQ